MIDFPDDPEINDIYAEGSREWKWTGSVWDLVAQSGPAGPVGPQGLQGATGPVGPSPVINTDGDPGTAIYVGSVDPDVSYTLATGDVWIEVP